VLGSGQSSNNPTHDAQPLASLLHRLPDNKSFRVVGVFSNSNTMTCAWDLADRSFESSVLPGGQFGPFHDLTDINPRNRSTRFLIVFTNLFEPNSLVVRQKPLQDSPSTSTEKWNVCPETVRGFFHYYELSAESGFATVSLQPRGSKSLTVISDIPTEPPPLDWGFVWVGGEIRKGVQPSGPYRRVYGARGEVEGNGIVQATVNETRVFKIARLGIVLALGAFGTAILFPVFSKAKEGHKPTRAEFARKAQIRLNWQKSYFDPIEDAIDRDDLASVRIIWRYYSSQSPPADLNMRQAWENPSLRFDLADYFAKKGALPEAREQIQSILHPPKHCDSRVETSCGAIAMWLTLNADATPERKIAEMNHWNTQAIANGAAGTTPDGMTSGQGFKILAASDLETSGYLDRALGLYRAAARLTPRSTYALRQYALALGRANKFALSEQVLRVADRAGSPGTRS
jgi:hypothetical protein